MPPDPEARCGGERRIPSGSCDWEPCPGCPDCEPVPSESLGAEERWTIYRVNGGHWYVWNAPDLPRTSPADEVVEVVPASSLTTLKAELEEARAERDEAWLERDVARSQLDVLERRTHG